VGVCVFSVFVLSRVESGLAGVMYKKFWEEIIYTSLQVLHVIWVPCHHGMGHPQDAAEILRMSPNILTK
jgi:hypothetical protein